MLYSTEELFFIYVTFHHMIYMEELERLVCIFVAYVYGFVKSYFLCTSITSS